MSGADGSVFPLIGNQLAAANPDDNVWLSASAGTGKTQVLSARVLRLLLTEEVEPSQILCLTFTKAGAAEMANRINAVLARWVRLPAVTLAKELGHLGADIGPATQERARSLFARVLDCPGGGLRIDTIHAFSQFLIGSFPEEAGLAPGTRVMDDRSRELLAREVLSELVETAEAQGDARFLDALAQFSCRKEPAALHAWLMRCADHAELWEGTTGWKAPMDLRVRVLLGVPTDAGEDWALEPLHQDVFPDHHLVTMLPILDGWKAKTGVESAAFIRQWLPLDVPARGEAAAQFRKTLLKSDGEPRQMQTPEKLDPLFKDRQLEIAAVLADVEARRTLLACVDIVTAALETGRVFALAWQARKAREGLVDFPDLIAKAAALLGNAEAADWIRYKLDRQFDHILIDEAQDTNESQWDIVFALIDDFFSGEGAHGDKLRTIFTVGDYKQAIFGFQGTSPENFAKAKRKVEARIMAARDGIRTGRVNRREPGWQDLDLGQSFRTANVVLDFVNRTIALLGHGAFGLDKAPGDHVGADRAGLVTLWRPAVPGADDAVEGEAETEERDNLDDAAERDWLPRHDTLLAEQIARQVQFWLAPGGEPFVLEKGTRRHARAGDIMVLVRQRKELAAQIVAKLYARGVPVAGVDRLRLGAPLAVKDLLAALRFAAQPLDDLSLANLLASPLIGWSQDDILAHVPRDKGMRLWDHLRNHPDPLVAATAERLRDLLRRTDYQTPQEMLAWLLNGPWQGRARLVERLGAEANDPVDELMNAAFAYEAEHPASLAGFLRWFDMGEGELKRDADGAGGLVRVMTVHGSKGLQAPIVILADATGEPGKPGALKLPDDPLGQAGPDDRVRHVPLPPLSKDQRAGRVAEAEEAAKAAAMAEHWRLLYVALTRAEEALFITGSLSATKAAKGPPEDSWYKRLEPLFPDAEIDDPVWGGRREWGRRADPLVPGDDVADGDAAFDLPRWALTPIGPEPRPPRPLAPSNAGEEAGSNPPLPPEAAKLAARRGSLIHRLLERLPDVAIAMRDDTARQWLARQAGDLPDEARAEMLASALGVIGDPAFAAIFAGEALAEVPLAAIVGGIVVSGTADRLLVEDTCVTVVDFKTTRRPPASAAAIPAPTLRQMAAYVAALEAIYPERTVRAGVLYTHAPVLFELAPDLLAPHKQRLGEPQQSFVPPTLE